VVAAVSGLLAYSSNWIGRMDASSRPLINHGFAKTTILGIIVIINGVPLLGSGIGSALVKYFQSVNQGNVYDCNSTIIAAWFMFGFGLLCDISYRILAVQEFALQKKTLSVASILPVASLSYGTAEDIASPQPDTDVMGLQDYVDPVVDAYFRCFSSSAAAHEIRSINFAEDQIGANCGR
jgi:hypothetical protein